MPKIPMSDRAGLIQHQSATVHQTGAPGMNFNMEDSRAIGEFGDRIGRAGEQVSNSLMRYAAMQAETENNLSAVQARNFYKKLNAELEMRMTEKPQDFTKFGEWAVETDKKYQDGVRQFTDRMTENFRKRFDAEMEGVRTETISRRKIVGMHAQTTANYNLFQSQWKDAAISGDEETCRHLMEQERGKLISEQEYQQKLLDFTRLRDSGAAKRLVDAGADGIIGRLKARGKDGSYSEFRDMETSYREQLIRIAEANDAKKRSDENQSLLDRLNSGDVVSVEDIDRAFEGKETPEAVKQKNQQRRIVQQFNHSQKLARDAAEREARREVREEAEFTRQQRKDAVDAHEFRLLSYEFASDPMRRQAQYAELRNEIFEEYAGDGPTVRRLIAQLDEKLKSVEKPDSSYKKRYEYEFGKMILNGMKNSFTGKSQWFRSDTYHTKENFRMAELQYDHFSRKNPEATIEERKSFLEQLRDDANQHDCEDMMTFWKSDRSLNLSDYTLKEGEVERMVNGRIAVFGSDKKFIRWEDGK